MTWHIPQGVIPNLLTPLTDDFEIDEPTLRRLVEFHCIRPHTSCFCVGPNLADSHNLSLGERRRITEVIVDQSAGRVAIMVSVSSPSLEQSLELAKHAAGVGAEAIYAVPPYNWELTNEQLLDYFVTLGESVPVSLIGYHIPSWQSGAGLEPDFVCQLAERLENFVGMKDASFNLRYFCELTALMRDVRPDFEVSPSLEWYLTCMPLGSRSAHSAITSIAPGLSHELFATAAAGDWAGARQAFLKFGRLWSVVYPTFPNSLKVAMDLMGRPVGPMRPPHEPLSGEAVGALRQELGSLEFLNSEPKGWEGGQ